MKKTLFMAVALLAGCSASGPVYKVDEALVYRLPEIQQQKIARIGLMREDAKEQKDKAVQRQSAAKESLDTAYKKTKAAEKNLDAANSDDAKKLKNNPDGNGMFVIMNKNGTTKSSIFNIDDKVYFNFATGSFNSKTGIYSVLAFKGKNVFVTYLNLN